MINPAQFQNVLEKINDQQLMGMLKRPDKIPTQFVVAEINRRQAMRQGAKAQQASMARQMPVTPQASQQMAPMGRPMPPQKPPQEQMPARGMALGGEIMPVPLPRPTLGQRNRNAFNLRPVSGEPFFGTSGRDKNNYSIFDSDLAGLRAGFVNMATQAEQGVDTIDEFFGEYAPLSENSAKSLSNYKNFAADKLGVSLDDKVDFADPSTQLKMADAIINFEQGGGDYYKKMKSLLPQAQKLSTIKDVNPLPKDKGSGFSLIKGATASTIYPSQSGVRPPIYAEIDKARNAGDIKTLQAFATDPSVLQTYGLPVQQYAIRAFGSLRANTNTTDDPPFVSRRKGPLLASQKFLDESEMTSERAASLASQNVGGVGPTVDLRSSNPSNRRRQRISPAGIETVSGPNRVSRMGKRGIPSASPEVPSGFLNDYLSSVVSEYQKDRKGAEPEVSKRGPTIAKQISEIRDVEDVTQPDVDEESKGTGSRDNRKRRTAKTKVLPPPTEMSPDFADPNLTKTLPEKIQKEITPIMYPKGAKLLRPFTEAAQAETESDITSAIKPPKDDFNALNKNQINDLPFFSEDDFRNLKDETQKLLQTYNDGTADLIKKRKEFLDTLNKQTRTPANMFFRSLIDAGLDLASSEETSFIKALAKSAKTGLNTFDNLTKQDQDKVYRNFKEAYNIASTEFDHKLKGQKLALDTQMSLLNIGETMSKMDLRSAQADYYRKGGIRNKSKFDAATYRSLTVENAKLLNDPMSALQLGVRLGVISQQDVDDGAELTPKLYSIIEREADKEARRKAAIAGGMGIATPSQSILPVTPNLLMSP